nr:hypothetical protein GCM10020185_87860 [Pseudomonas brassicacearum subsp. brassicacearum]
MAQKSTNVFQGVGNFKRGQDSDDAVKPATPHYRVAVRATDERFQIGLATIELTNQIAAGIQRHCKARQLEFRSQPLPGSFKLR